MWLAGQLSAKLFFDFFVRFVALMPSWHLATWIERHHVGQNNSRKKGRGLKSRRRRNCCCCCCCCGGGELHKQVVAPVVVVHL